MDWAMARVDRADASCEKALAREFRRFWIPTDVPFRRSMSGWNPATVCTDVRPLATEVSWAANASRLSWGYCPALARNARALSSEVDAWSWADRWQATSPCISVASVAGTWGSAAQ